MHCMCFYVIVLGLSCTLILFRIVEKHVQPFGNGIADLFDHLINILRCHKHSVEMWGNQFPDQFIFFRRIIGAQDIPHTF